MSGFARDLPFGASLVAPLFVPHPGSFVEAKEFAAAIFGNWAKNLAAKHCFVVHQCAVFFGLSFTAGFGSGRCS